ncbi:MAG: HDOD domain-containing protein [Deltaproteobacteria bacterium]|nr:HDOD domain-containing protein [Deltaproteobacteria bacterium]
MHDLPKITIDPDTFLRQHCSLPSLPPVVSHIQQTLQSDNIDISQVVDLISAEPALVAQILKVVNSSYYGLPREIAEVRFAIAFLGLNEIYRMVLSLSVIKTMSVKEQDELDRFWFHSFYTALCTKLLARKYDPHLPFDELWSAAILHDIGRLVYLKFFPQHYQLLQEYCKEAGCMMNTAEEHFELPASTYLGVLLCDHWRLPTTIQDACKYHRMEDLKNLSKNNEKDNFRRTLCLGNLVAALTTEVLSEPVKIEIAGILRSELGCDEEAFLALMGEIYDQRLEAEGFINQFK